MVEQKIEGKFELLERANRTMFIDWQTLQLLQRKDVDFIQARYYLIMYSLGLPYEELKYMRLAGYNAKQLGMRLKVLLRYRQNRKDRHGKDYFTRA